MTVWIVLSIILVLLSPIAWLKPSRRQSGRMAARMQARRLGLGMQLAPESWPHWMGGQAPDTCPQYSRPRTSASAACWCYWQPSPGRWVNQWQEPCEDERLQAQLSQLPADVWKVQADARMLALWWGERGDVAVVDQIIKALA
ncbi:MULTISPECIES: hypothetical protein [unclassified Pseudomonas]|uniref:hypothetical protein n=1 Tax=unclassified Pseudomonas TaxID=196821 RepID=UPI000BD618F6|nr:MULTISPECIES: hypothetical protein [unclassified Pseudomonas]PVZ20346.1 hypothetical protein F474_00945 [Pseudomonas sp. URIL14HWK12:I12]PVZ27412.1 hypothetical protein F470_00600 [Pseudomonas sp. URIL14HWK12:I10]PVZ38301.1 hypothetical protein F472_00945 [Pseudomonas sp. URIL14HWK12:I11]SNZ03901.1 hypothetical protein SAMN05660463_00459 [Pseudomonas sp. URIL14HWK12:I9]